MTSRLSLVCLLAVSTFAHAGEKESRSFSIRVDNKQAGTHYLVIQTSDDGAATVTSQADVSVRIALISYKYSFRGNESWNGSRLLQMTSTTNDDGKKYSVAVEANKEGLAVTANGKSFQVKGQPWLTTYWKLPPENQRGPNVTLLDADTGKLINAKMEKFGIEKITVLGKAVDCVHYKLTGGVQVDLWYDGTDRMVRQESIEEGHRTLLELSRLQRE
jgi:hypothetical protein